MEIDNRMTRIWTLLGLLCVLVPVGCVATDAALKETENRIKTSNARQRDEISVLRDQDFPQLRGDLDRALHQAQQLQGKQEDLKQRASQIEQQTKKLEQVTAKIEIENTSRQAGVQKSLDSQDLKHTEDRDRFRAELNGRLDMVYQQMETLRKELIEAVLKTNSSLMKNVEVRLEGQQKVLDEGQQRSDVVVARLAEQAHHLDVLAEAIDQVAADRHLRSDGKSGLRQSPMKLGPRSARVPSLKPSKSEEEMLVVPVAPQVDSGVVSPATLNASEEPTSLARSASSVRSDKLEYERALGIFRSGNFDGAREGFLAFLRDYPTSELSSNASYWLGESYAGGKKYKQAIDWYERVELDFPKSEKVPAALLKKGYAYGSLNDRKRAVAAFRQVLTLYPQTSEAVKASEKLSQLTELR